MAMSGGVDSSLAAYLLKNSDRELIGVNMRTHKLTPEEIAMGAQIKTCCSPTDAKDARACAEQSDFPFYVLDVEEEFKRDVIGPFIESYRTGRTPNPCVLCNSHVKLGLLLEKAKIWGCSKVATGHYAKVTRVDETGRWTLQKAADKNKDQTYYLFGLQQHQLDMLELPLGDLVKKEVRELASENGIPTASKPESQEICFIPSNDYRAFLRKQFASQGVSHPKGKFISTTGKVLGEHEGIPFYTVGQRRGLGLSGAHPYYIVEIDVENNNIIVGPREAVLFDGLHATDMNWMAVENLTKPIEASVQIRHRHKAAPAIVYPPDSENRIHIEFKEPQQAVSPGQAAVIYDSEERVIGGGWIIKGYTKPDKTEP